MDCRENRLRIPGIRQPDTGRAKFGGSGENRSVIDTIVNSSVCHCAIYAILLLKRAIYHMARFISR